MFVTKPQKREFPITRHQGWEEILEPLVRKITGAVEGKVRTGCDFENDVFTMKMHFVGTCPCNYNVEFKKYAKQHNHSTQCFHTNWNEINQAFRSHPRYHNALILKTERINMEMQLCRRYGIPFRGGEYSQDICTCPFDKNWQEMDIQHADDCPVISPNFYHAKSGLKIWWTKKFFRDAYMNQITKIEDFTDMIIECVKSV